MVTRAFTAMGTTVELRVDAPESPDLADALDRATASFREVESVCSRFDERSELSTLNRRGSCDVSPLLAEVVEIALDGRTRTGGLFDPTVHDAVAAAGYDRDFALLDDAPRPAAPTSAPAGGAVSVHGTRVVLGAGTRLDLGGIAKGYAVDRACAVLAEVGPCLVDAGGDIATRGGGWPIGLDTGDGTLTLELGDGAVATSGRDRRHWTRGSEELHHIIDPATGLPAAGDLLRVTAVAATATDAEVQAKALFLAGAEEAEREANATATPALLVTLDGRTLFAGGLA